MRVHFSEPIQPITVRIRQRFGCYINKILNGMSESISMNAHIDIDREL